MGDLIELTTIADDRALFYKISSGGLRVDIKGESAAIIGLAKKVANYDFECDYLIVIGHNQKSWIKKLGDNIKMVKTPNLLNQDEYRSFWVLWDSRSISFGREGEDVPLVKYGNVVKPINYITFAVSTQSTPIHWRFELAPDIPGPFEMKPLHGGEPRWVNLEGGQLPHGAVIGGYENGTLYVIRAKHQESLTPGKFVPSEGVGYISWGSAAHEKEDFEVLVGYNYAWIPTSEDQIPTSAIVGGHTEHYISEKLYVGRVKQGDHIIPGKVQPSHKVCYVPFEGRECSHRSYEILVSIGHNKRCYNSVFPANRMEFDSPNTSDDENDME